MLKGCKTFPILLLLLLTVVPAWAQKDSDLDAFFRAVTDGRADLVKTMLKEHPEWVDREMYMGIRPLYRAAVLGRSEVAQLLLEAGADPNAVTNRAHLPIHAAARNGHLGVLMLLLAHKSALDNPGEDGHTALHLATRYKQAKIVDELLKNGAGTNILNKRGRTPLHIAAGLGQPAMVTALVEAGAELNIVDKAGFSPLGLARTAKRNSYGDIGGYLEAKGGQDIRPDDGTKTK